MNTTFTAAIIAWTIFFVSGFVVEGEKRIEVPPAVVERLR